MNFDASSYPEHITVSNTISNDSIDIREDMIQKTTNQAQNTILNHIFGNNYTRIKALLNTLSHQYNDCEFEVRITDEVNTYGNHTSLAYWNIIGQDELVCQSYNDDVVITYQSPINITDIKFRQTFKHSDYVNNNSPTFSYPFERKTRIISYESPFNMTNDNKYNITPISVKLSVEDVIPIDLTNDNISNELIETNNQTNQNIINQFDQSNNITTSSFLIDNYERRQRCSYRFTNPELAHWRVDKTVRFITKNPDDKRLHIPLSKSNVDHPKLYDFLDLEIEYIGMPNETTSTSSCIYSNKLYDIVYSFFKLIEVLNPNFILFNIDYLLIKSIIKFDPTDIITKTDILTWNTISSTNTTNYIIRYEPEIYDKVAIFVINDDVYILSHDFRCDMPHNESIFYTFKKLYNPIKSFDANSIANLMLKFKYIDCTKSFYLTVIECCRVLNNDKYIYFVDDAYMIKSKVLNNSSYLDRLNLVNDYIMNNENEFIRNNLTLIPCINISSFDKINDIDWFTVLNRSCDLTVSSDMNGLSGMLNMQNVSVDATNENRQNDKQINNQTKSIKQSKRKTTKNTKTSKSSKTNKSNIITSSSIDSTDSSIASNSINASNQPSSQLTYSIPVNGIRCKSNSSTLLSSTNLIYRLKHRNSLNVRISYNLKYNNFEIFVIRDKDFDQSKVKTAIKNSDIYEADNRFIKFTSLYQEINTINLLDTWNTTNFSTDDINKINSLIIDMRNHKEQYNNSYIKIVYGNGEWVPYEVIDITKPNMSKYISTYSNAKLCSMLIFNTEDANNVITKLGGFEHSNILSSLTPIYIQTIESSKNLHKLTLPSIQSHFKQIYTSTYNLIDQYIIELFINNDKQHEVLVNIIDSNINNSNILFSLTDYYNIYIIGNNSSSLIDYIKFNNFENISSKFKTILKSNIKPKIRALNQSLKYGSEFMLSLINHFDNISHSADCIYVQDCQSLCSIDGIIKFIETTKYVLSPNGRIILKYIDECMLKDAIEESMKSNGNTNPFMNIRIVNNFTLLSDLFNSVGFDWEKVGKINCISNEIIGICDVFNYKNIRFDVDDIKFDNIYCDDENDIFDIRCVKADCGKDNVNIDCDVNNHIVNNSNNINIENHIVKTDCKANVDKLNNNILSQSEKYSLLITDSNKIENYVKNIYDVILCINCDDSINYEQFTDFNIIDFEANNNKYKLFVRIRIYNFESDASYMHYQNTRKALLLDYSKQVAINKQCIFHRFMLPNTKCENMQITKLLNNNAFKLFNEDFIITNICQPITRQEVMKDIITNKQYALIENVERYFRALSIVEIKYK